MVRLLSLVILCFWCQLSVNKPTTEDPAGVTFQIKNAGITVNGSFSDLQADIRFDPTRLTESSFNASVSAATIRTGIALRDGHLQKRGYFDTEHYPRIQMVSKGIQKLTGNRYLGLFNLTIRETTREVELPFTYAPRGNTGRFTGQFVINRQTFGIGTTSLVLADDVTVLVDVETPLKPL